jgi:hypothetical protein
MAKRTYLLPQVIVQQDFVALPAAATQDLIAVIVGPQKLVRDVNDPEDESFVDYGAYNSVTDQTYKIKGYTDSDLLERDSVLLNLKNVTAKYAQLSSPTISVGSVQNLLKISDSADGFVAYPEISASRNAAFKNRDVKVGDSVVVSSGGVTQLKTRVFDIIRDRVDAQIGTISADISNKFYSSNAFSVAINEASPGSRSIAESVSSDYSGDLRAGRLDDTYTVTVTAGGSGSAAKFSVTSLNGDNVSVSSISGISLAVGTNGLSIDFSSTNNFVIGDSYVISVAKQFQQSLPSIDNADPGKDYAGLYDTVYEVEVIRGGTWSQSIELVVTTNNAVDALPPQKLNTTDGTFFLGSLGLVGKINLMANAGLRTGDIFYIPVVASTAGEARTIKLLDKIPSSVNPLSSVTVEFCHNVDSIVIPRAGYPRPGDNAWSLDVDDETGEANLTLQSDIYINDSQFTELSGALSNLEIKSARVFIGYKALQLQNALRINSISEPSLIPAQCGKLVPENPIAYGVLKALQNSGGTRVYFVPVDEDNLDGYTRAFDSTLNEVTAYYIVPMSNDERVIQAAKAHVVSASDEMVARERIAIVNQSFSPTTMIYDKLADGQTAWTGYVEMAPGTEPAVYNRVTIPGASLLTDRVRAGDTFRSNFTIDALGNDVYQSFKVVEVIDEQTLRLESPAFASPVGSESSPRRIQIVRNLTKREQAEKIAASSERLGNRRVVNVWPDVLRDGDLSVAGYFAGAAIAGLKSGVAPHQPVTNVVINGFTRADRSTPYFTMTDLNIVAGGGTWIIDQDRNGGEIFNRHQLTTDYTDDNMAEVSITTNLDSISKLIREDLRQFIGQWNNHPFFQQLLKTRLVDRLTFLQGRAVTVKAGPQLLNFEITNIGTDPLIRTRVLVDINLTLPYPVNVIQVKLTVI